MVKHWKYQELEELFSFVIGGDWGKDVSATDQDLIETYCIRGSELKNWRKEKGRTAALRKVSSSSLQKRKLQEGDILVEISGGGPDQPVGRTVLIDKEVLGIEPETPKVCTNFFRLVRLVDEVDKAFINYFLTFIYVSGQVVNYQGGSNNLRNLRFAEYAKIKVPLPALPEQKRIVAKLDTLFAHLDQLKTRLDKIPVLLKQFRQAVLTQAVTGKLTEEWRQAHSSDRLYSEKVEAIHRQKKDPVKYRERTGFVEGLKLFPIPEEWTWISNYKLAKDGSNSICAGPFGTIFKARDFRSEGIPIIFLRHIKPGKFEWRKNTWMDRKVWKEYHQPYSVFGGELLVTKLGDPPGDCAIYPATEGVSMVTPDVIKMNVNENVVITKYLMYFLNSDASKDILNEISFGMTRLRIDITMFKAMPIPLPDMTEQKVIVQQVESLFAIADRIEARCKTLEENIDYLPEAIFSKAFSGELSSDELP